jgi:hypothetical protein
MNSEAGEVRSPVQFATALALIITQAMFLFSLSYWFGFSAVSGINVVRNFSLIEIFTSVADRRLGSLIILIVISAVLTVVMMAQRERHLGFIDDPAVKVPGFESAAASTGERYMTQRQLAPILFI